MSSKAKKPKKLQQNPPFLFAAALIVAAALSGIAMITFYDAASSGLVHVIQLVILGLLALQLFIRGATVSISQKKRVWAVCNAVAILGIVGFVVYLSVLAYDWNSYTFGLLR